MRRRSRAPRPRLKYYFVASARHGVAARVGAPWRISAGRSSSSTRNSKPNSGLDHFEGRTYPGWQHHVVLTAVAHAYIQRERMRRRRGRG